MRGSRSPVAEKFFNNCHRPGWVGGIFATSVDLSAPDSENLNNIRLPSITKLKLPEGSLKWMQKLRSPSQIKLPM